jgi:ribosome modulation factor
MGMFGPPSDLQWESVERLQRIRSLGRAFNEGYSAGYEGVLMNDNVNPYKEESLRFKMWNEGFSEGAADN